MKRSRSWSDGRRAGRAWPLAWLALATPGAVRTAAQQPEVFVGRTAELYVSGTVIDGRGGPPRPETAILVWDGRIQAIGARDQMTVPRGTAIVDLDGAVVVPGYIDAYGSVRDPVALPRMLAAGIMGVREAATPLDEFEKAGRSVDTGGPGPDVYIGGPALDAGAGAMGLVLSSEEDVEGAVRRLVEEEGARFVSITSAVPAEWIPGITRAARRIDAAVWANPRASGWLLALRAGVDVTSGLISGDPDMLPEADREAYAFGLDRSGPPPIEAWLSALDPAGPEVERAITALLSRDAAVIPLLVDAAGLAEIASSWHAAEELVRRLHREGVRLLVGSGLTGGAERFHGELERLVAAGIPAVDVLAMATRNAAAALGVLHDRGTLETGKRADFVVLAGDPVADMRNARRVDFLVVGGDPWRSRSEGGFERMRFRRAPPGPEGRQPGSS